MLWIDFIPLLGQIALMGGGAIIVRKASRPLNDHPRCKRCGFDLSAHDFVFNRGLLKVVAAPGSVESDKAICSECGTRLTQYDSVRFGTRQVNRPLFALGIAIALTPLIFFISTTRVGGTSQFVTRNTPDAMVVRLGESGSDYRFSAELLRRINAGELSKPALDELVKRATARLKQPTRNSHFYSQQLLGTLIDTGAITPADLASILGEPRVSLHLAPRTYRNWAPIVRASAVVDTPNIPDRMMVSVENVTAYLTDMLDSRGQMTQWEVIDGSARAGGMSDGQSTSSGNRVLSLRPINADARGTFKSDLMRRDYDISADIVISRNGVEILRRHAFAIGQQELIETGEPLFVLDMDPAVNAAARVCYDGMWAAFSPPNGQPRANLSLYWPHNVGGPTRMYRVTVRPAGKPDAPPLIDEVLVAPGIEKINGAYFYRLRTKVVVDADFTAVDVHFEPDLQAAAKHFDGLTATSIAGEAFTIRDVFVRLGPQPPSQP